MFQVEQDNDALKKTISELETTIKKQEQEKQSKDHQIRSLQVKEVQIRGFPNPLFGERAKLKEIWMKMRLHNNFSG